MNNLRMHAGPCRPLLAALALVLVPALQAATPPAALVVSRRALQLGFTSTVGIIHDGDGQLQPLSDEERGFFLKIKTLEKKNYSRFNHFQDNIR